jgi:RNA polymerase sigma factor (sigma-70 family)
MVNAQLHGVLRHLHSLRETQTVAEASDSQLLDWFAHRREEMPFTALMRRHGPMVWGVSRRLLHHTQDAEDVFQATFLLLAQKAASIRKQSSVGSWLHGVAHRLALKARVRQTRQQNRERRAAEAQPMKRDDDSSWQELQAALDAALDRLPERYRAALVLCYLEGKSHAEAARQLGCPLPTLRTHVARGRKLLRDRLMKHGLTLSTAGIVSLLLASAASSAAPTTLTKATTKAALALAAGQKAAAVCSAPVAALVNGGLRTMFVGKMKWAMALFLAASVAAVACGLAQSPAADETAKPQATSAKPQAAKEADDKEAVAFNGRVLDPDGKPLTGAKLYMTKAWYSLKRPGPSPLYATTGEDGRFSFTVPKETVVNDQMELVVTAKGFGPDWITVGPNDKKENLTIQLVKDDLPIAGQIVDLQGKPARGATVRLTGIDAAPKDDLGPWLKAVKGSTWDSINLQHKHLTRRLTSTEVPALPQAAITDADGKFRFTGIGRDRLVHLRIDAPTIASQELHILTRAGKAIEAPEVKANAEYGIEGLTVTYYPASFKHVAGPTKPITGIVRDKDTGSPLTGVSVKSYKLANNPIHGLEFLETKTDAQGRYRLTGMPKGKGNKILFEAPEDQPYLMVHAVVPDTDGLDPVTVDFEMKRGVWIEGQVTDKATGKLVPCHVEYFALFGNPNLKDHPGYQGTHVNRHNWKADGTFRVVGLPGPGILTVWAGDEYLTAVERDDADGSKTVVLGTDPVHASAYNVNAVARIDPPQNAESFKRVIVLDPGETFTGALVDLDGKPVEGARSYGLSSQAGWERPPLKTAEFAVRGFNPRRPRPVLFRHVEKNLVAVFDPPKDAKKPSTVRMQPGAIITGRLVDANGQPRPNVEMDVSARDDKGASIGFSLPNKVKTDSAGRFRIDALLPGYKYELNDHHGFLRDMLQLNVGLRAGETKDLGDVQLKRPGE